MFKNERVYFKMTMKTEEANFLITRRGACAVY